jgi:hypothetical protein
MLVAFTFNSFRLRAALAASIYFTILMENKRVVGHVATKGLSEFRFQGKIVKM